MFNFTKIKSNEAAFFAYKVWRVPYIIGAFIILFNFGLIGLMGSFGSIITLGLVGFIRDIFRTIFFTSSWLIGWTVGSSLIFLFAFTGKKFSRRSPFLIFVLFPLPISLISLFIFYKIILMVIFGTKDISTFLGPLGFILVVGSAGIVSIILIVINLVSWKAALKEYRSVSFSST